MHNKYFTRKIDKLEKIPSKHKLHEHIIVIGGGTVGGGLAKLLIISIPKHSDVLEMIKEARKLNPKITIFATERYFHETLDFYKAGVDFVSMPYVIGSNLFLENITKFLQTGKIMYIQNFKTEYMRYLEDKVEEERKYKPHYFREFN